MVIKNKRLTVASFDMKIGRLMEVEQDKAVWYDFKKMSQDFMLNIISLLF